ncbi:MAG: glycosyltransferase family 4 protein [Sphingobacteriaceae bacterium]|nr:glycosyltransferase family 4 protein [Sphingobacteriaceae bacterium]
MPRVLILVAHRPNRSPSQRYRFEQYLPYLQQHGFEFTWSPLLNEKDDAVFYGKGSFFKKLMILLKGHLQRRRDVSRFKEFDIIFIQREASFFGSSYFEMRAHKSGKKVIFDFDDAIWMADTSPGNKKWEWVKDPKKFNANVSFANLVIAGNTYLADKAKNFAKADVHIIPTTVDTNVHIPKWELRGKEKITIGWSGSFSTIKHFEEVVSVLKALNKKHQGKLQFKVLGDSNYKNEELEIKGIAWSLESEVNELNSFDIGLMPLPNDEWAKGKCGLKALTYMSCEVPVVMSGVGVNTEIAENGCAIIANTKEEWMNALEELINDKSKREALGKKGRNRVEEKYSVDANREKYLEVFKDFMELR